MALTHPHFASFLAIHSRRLSFMSPSMPGLHIISWFFCCSLGFEYPLFPFFLSHPGKCSLFLHNVALLSPPLRNLPDLTGQASSLPSLGPLPRVYGLTLPSLCCGSLALTWLYAHWGQGPCLLSVVSDLPECLDCSKCLIQVRMNQFNPLHFAGKDKSRSR